MTSNIRKRGDTYYYDFMIDGKRYKGTTKTDDKKLAQNIADTIKADVIRKKHSLPSTINYIFKDVWEVYMSAQICGLSSSKRKHIAAKHFLSFLKDKSIQSITTDQIENYQLQRKLELMAMPRNAGKREQDISFHSINIEITTLHHFFNFCMKKGYLDKNPTSGIKKLNELSRLKTLSDDDIDKLIHGATNKLTRDLITFLIYTGCRKGEALNLKWDDVDLQNDVIAIKGTKTKYDRYVPIHTQLKELLTGIERNQISLPASSEKHDFSAGKDDLYVFNKNGAKLTDFKRSFHTACKNAGVKDLRIHDLRHVFASKMVMNGTSLYITGELLGHRTYILYTL